MDVEKIYREIGEDYESVAARLGNPALIARLLEMFADDKNFVTLETALADGDCETAFRAAHTLKGVAMNMGFSKLASSVSELTELLRKGAVEGSGKLLEAAADEYRRVIDRLAAAEE